MCSDPIDLPGENAPLARVKTEFDRGRTGVDHADERLRSSCVHRE
jgi:hypothetical protein